MSIVLYSGATEIVLHEDLRWVDEDSWHPVAQVEDRGITGALIVQAAAMTAGRPITLEPENEGSAWMHSSVVEQLRNLAVVPGLQMELSIRDIRRAVIFRHSEIALETTPVVHYNDRMPGDWFLCTLRFLEL